MKRRFFGLMAHQGTQILTGTIIDALPNAMFKVRLDDSREILGVLAGKLRIHRIIVLRGDRVQVEMSDYDKDRGRIVFRLK